MPPEQGSTTGGPNSPSAEPGAVLRAYYARKRLIAMRSSWFLAPLAILLALRAPVYGVFLVLGGVCGVINILAIMSANERLLDGRRSRGMYLGSNMIRVLAFGAIPVIAATHEPLGVIGVDLAGFFTPLALYVIELRRDMTRG